MNTNKYRVKQKSIKFHLSDEDKRLIDIYCALEGKTYQELFERYTKQLNEKVKKKVIMSGGMT